MPRPRAATFSLDRYLCLPALILLCLMLFASPALSAPQAPSPDQYVVKVAYVVPFDRKPLPDYRSRIDFVMKEIQEFYADQMAVHGFGRRTFALDTGFDGRMQVNLIRSGMSTLEFEPAGQVPYQPSRYWNHCTQALTDAGFRPLQRGIVWVLFVETQVQGPDGGILGATNGGNSGFECGCCVNTTTSLTLSSAAFLHDRRPYDGLVLPPIGPAKLVAHKSFPIYCGDDVNSLAGLQLAAVAHEMGHSFQLAHCGINDTEQNGNLMGAGFRGWRGYYMPNAYPDEETRLDRPSALVLSLSPFFRARSERVPAGKPAAVEVITPLGDMKIEDGKFKLTFSATQPEGPGLALATLENGSGRDGVWLVAWKEFPGNPRQVTATIEASMIVPGREDNWRLCVYDRAGVCTIKIFTMKAPNQTFAPVPRIIIGHTRLQVGTHVKLQATCMDRRNCNYVWSFGDGETAAGAQVDHVYQAKGTFEIKLKAVDPTARFSETSMFVSVRTDPPRDR